jgi:hypothetical protein
MNLRGFGFNIDKSQFSVGGTGYVSSGGGGGAASFANGGNGGSGVLILKVYHP